MKVIPEIGSRWNLNGRVVEVVGIRRRTKGHAVSYVGAAEDYRPDEEPSEMGCKVFNRTAKAV